MNKENIRNVFYYKNYYLNFFNTMRSLLFLIALILFVGWILGLIIFTLGKIIHILLLLAIISVLLGVIRRGRL